MHILRHVKKGSGWTRYENLGRATSDAFLESEAPKAPGPCSKCGNARHRDRSGKIADCSVCEASLGKERYRRRRVEPRKWCKKCHRRKRKRKDGRLYCLWCTTHQTTVGLQAFNDYHNGAAKNAVRTITSHLKAS